MNTEEEKAIINKYKEYTDLSFEELINIQHYMFVDKKENKVELTLWDIQRYLINFEYIKSNNLKIGTKLIVKTINGEEEKTINWINSYYGYFGDKDQINIKDIITIKGGD